MTDPVPRQVPLRKDVRSAINRLAHAAGRRHEASEILRLHAEVRSRLAAGATAQAIAAFLNDDAAG